MNIFFHVIGVLLLLLFTLGTLMSPLSIGKERKPTTPGFVVSLIIVNGFLIATLAYFLLNA